MTERLYLTDNYISEFQAKIIDITPKGVILDKTAFYPESGGQLGDRGTLEINDKTFNVTNTKLDKGKILHYISEKDLSTNAEVKCKIDWDFRYKLMRSHSAQHIISRWEVLIPTSLG